MQSTQALPSSIRAIEDWLIVQTAKQTGQPAKSIDTTQPFAAYGLDSISATLISGDLELWLNVKLDPTVLWDYPTIDELATYLFDLVYPAENARLVSEFSAEAV